MQGKVTTANHVSFCFNGHYASPGRSGLRLAAPLSQACSSFPTPPPSCTPQQEPFALPALINVMVFSDPRMLFFFFFCSDISNGQTRTKTTPWTFLLRWQTRKGEKANHSKRWIVPRRGSRTQQVCIRRGCLNSLARQFTLGWHQLHQYFKLLPLVIHQASVPLQNSPQLADTNGATRAGVWGALSPHACPPGSRLGICSPCT